MPEYVRNHRRFSAQPIQREVGNLRFFIRKQSHCRLRLSFCELIIEFQGLPGYLPVWSSTVEYTICDLLQRRKYTSRLKVSQSIGHSALHNLATGE